MTPPGEETIFVRILDVDATARTPADLRSIQTMDLLISPRCPRCGKPRGRPRAFWFTAPWGEPFHTDVWVNPCGHADTYAAVLDEPATRILNGDREPMVYGRIFAGGSG